MDRVLKLFNMWQLGPLYNVMRIFVRRGHLDHGTNIINQSKLHSLGFFGYKSIRIGPTLISVFSLYMLVSCLARPLSTVLVYIDTSKQALVRIEMESRV